eukprot:c24938_g1_i1 orf=669-2738(+)
MASLVERATSEMLIGPDWAKNLEICDVINTDPRRAKDIMKAIKKRLGNKLPKVQLLALTVLETMIKNCGDVVHHQVVERDILIEMVKIVRKQRDLQVKEKILVLLNSWQEAFGVKYPQYYMAYDELQRSGFTLPRQADDATPIFTPPQTHPITTYPPSPPRSPSRTSLREEMSIASDLPVMSLTEVQTARSGMEVLMEMLSAIDPSNKQALRDDVIMELVEQCHIAEQRVMQLVNSTSDEELLRQGLALNDDLQRVLTKHHAIESGTLPKEHIPTAPSAQLINVNDAKESKDDLPQSSQRSALLPPPQNQAQANGTQQAFPAPLLPQKTMAAPAVTREQTIDLLSGDLYEDKSQNATSLVPLNGQYSPSSTSLSEQKALILFDSNMSPQDGLSASPLYNLSPQQQQQSYLQSNGILSQSSQQNKYQQFEPQMTLQGHIPNQLQHTNYVVPWARSSEQLLSPQQQALIYGAEAHSSHVQSPQSPQQLVLTHTSQQLASQPVFTQSYSSQLQSPQGYHAAATNPPQQPQQNFGLQQSLHLPQQPQQNFGSGAFNTSEQPLHGTLPAPPWSTEAMQTVLQPVQQGTLMYGYSIVPALPTSPVQPPQWQQFWQQSHMASGQFVPAYAIQPNLAGQLQNLSLYGGGFYMPGQSAGQYMQQAGIPTYQKQAHYVKEEKSDDRLFKDLVDIAKSKS